MSAPATFGVVAIDLPRVLAMRSERRRITYEGSVQGVGFRMTARRLASDHPVSGYVRNLDDGRVELVVEGETSALDCYLDAILREFGDMIHDIRTEDRTAADEPLAGFTIRYT